MQLRINPLFTKATVYTHLLLNPKMLHFAPLAPQIWGEPELQSPPELGDLGGNLASYTNQRTCVYTVALTKGRQGGFLLMQGKPAWFIWLTLEPCRIEPPQKERRLP